MCFKCVGYGECLAGRICRILFHEGVIGDEIRFDNIIFSWGVGIEATSTKSAGPSIGTCSEACHLSAVVLVQSDFYIFGAQMFGVIVIVPEYCHINDFLRIGL